MLSYSFSNMAAAKKAKEALKALGFTRVTLDAHSGFHSDTEFSLEHGFNIGNVAGSMHGGALYSYDHESLSMTLADPFISGGTSDEYKQFRTKLIVDEGESDPQLVDKIVSEYIGLA